MMIQESPIGYGYTTQGYALAGSNRDPNSFRTPKRLPAGPIVGVLLLGLLVGYCFHKYAKK